MRAIYFVGILAFFLITVSAASASTEFYLTEVNEDKYDGLIQIKVVYDEKTISVEDFSSGLVDSSNVDIKAIGIVNPPNNPVVGVNDLGYNSIWTFGEGAFNRAGFGSFSSLCESSDKTKTRGRIVIELNEPFDTLPENEYGNSIIVHISFGDEDNPDEVLVGSTWVGGSSQIPEFPSVAIPVMAILGIIFISQNRKKER